MNVPPFPQRLTQKHLPPPVHCNAHQPGFGETLDPDIPSITLEPIRRESDRWEGLDTAFPPAPNLAQEG